MSDNIYDADYFLHGRKSGKSLYENYRWLPKLTIPMAQHIIDHCGIDKGANILDFGCARGYLVRAMRGLGYNAWGVDVSRWAIDNADDEARPYLTCLNDNDLPLPISRFDWIIAKDVLEHVTFVSRMIDDLMSVADKGVFAVVPLSRFDRQLYVIEEYEKDITHVQRWPLMVWAGMFVRVGWSVELSYRIEGIKDNYYKPGWEMGNGFITARRI